MPIVDAFKPFKRIEVDAYFVEKANIALAAYKMFDTEDRNYMAKVIPFFRQMDASNNAELKEGQQKVERVFTGLIWLIPSLIVSESLSFKFSKNN